MITHAFPCDEGNTTCIDSKDGYQERELELKNCSSEVRDELYAYYKGRNKLLGDFALYAMCVDDDEDLFIQGEPFAWNTQASFEIAF